MSSNRMNVYESLPTETDTQRDENRICNLLNEAIPKKDMTRAASVMYLLARKKAPNKKAVIKRKKGKLSRKEKQKLNLLKVPKTGWDYNEFETLRVMWTQYMISLLNLDNVNKSSQVLSISGDIYKVLSRADYHGAEMTVVRSKCPSVVGITGTCILDTKCTFRILSKDNKARIVPKKESVFKIYVKNFELLLYGKYFGMQPWERGAKKIKTGMILDL